MKKNNVLFNILVFVLAAFILASCRGVTETGNPCQTENCNAFVEQQPTGQDEPETPGTYEQKPAAYNNEEFGVNIYYPSGWTYPKDENNADVTFSYTEVSNKISTAKFEFSKLDESPSSLKAYLEKQYPGLIFVSYSTGTLSGFEYDEPKDGLNGTDVREHYFLNEKVLVHVHSTLFSSATEGFKDLLAGISFE